MTGHTELSQHRREQVLDEQRHVTEKITDLVRYIGFGVAAICYSIFTSDSAFSKELLNDYKNHLLISAMLAVLTVLFDYLQFLFGYISVRKALRNTTDDYKYLSDNLFYKGRFIFYYTKQITVLSAVLLLLYTLMGNLNG